MKTARHYIAMLGLLVGVSSATYGQDSTSVQAVRPPLPASHTLFAGLQVPLNYTVGYRYQVSQRISVQAQGGLIAAPFDRYTLALMEGFGLDPTLSRVIDRSFRRGSSASLGVNIHANSPWYGGLFGQYTYFSAGPITPADGLSVYFKQDFSGFGLLDSPSFVFNLQSSLWLAGLRVGRSFQFGDSPFGLATELSLSKIVATQNTFSSNRALVDGLGVTQRLYGNLNNEIDTKLRQHGFLPTLNVLLTYRLR
ncbi:hypothetical protein FAES_5089 [Fibrella aestuarina BUZ 2]|uniref:Outer membrane protein beta-barrel domain-containing protein n=1 Tax=Fibrella aestuarina BUZ 2 TaxID=1166018 RepID=I0KG35_9BACT|nr:hypothetical protein [Fibrella aestuarina]CCH03088.1 hypothetical protein FAES_5089 [Fibrella aestuarina BUZ 2]